MSIKNLTTTASTWNRIGDDNINNNEPFLLLDLANGFAPSLKLGVSYSMLGTYKILRVGILTNAVSTADFTSFSAGPLPVELRPQARVTIPMNITIGGNFVVCYVTLEPNGNIVFTFTVTIHTGITMNTWGSSIMYV